MKLFSACFITTLTKKKINTVENIDFRAVGVLNNGNFHKNTKEQ